MRTPGIFCALVLAAAAYGQPPVPIFIDTGRDTGAISPYIYGSNGQGGDREAGITARRLGGNRLTGYNWENNASNAGSDYLHQSDNYLTWISGIAPSYERAPGVVCTAFHDTSLALKCYSLITLPAAGYVAADKSGPVSVGETAPSKRWRGVKFSKGAPFVTPPDTSDSNVYDDEEVHFFVDQFGGALSTRGIRGYAVDNEPALWVSTHPRIHPVSATCSEIISKSIALSLAVKSVDHGAEIFGPVLYGFAAYTNFQTASDWNVYASKGWFISAYLDAMRAASDTAGRRLLDVLDLHWYPEALGRDAAGTLQRITLSDNHDPGVAAARMQAPRTLWDSSYTENSWIGQYFSPVALLPHIRASIARYYPGTKLAFTEFNYGGDHDISGGIAVADVLGLFGKYGVYMSNHWGAVQGYLLAGYRIYRDYDGRRSTFGDVRVHASTDSVARMSVYAALRSANDSLLDVIVINKDNAGSTLGTITIGGSRNYSSGRVWAFAGGDSTIREIAPIAAISNNHVEYNFPALSVCHMVLRRTMPSAIATTIVPPGSSLIVSPNPSHGALRITIPMNLRYGSALAIRDILGRIVGHWENVEAGTVIEWGGGAGTTIVPTGLYSAELHNGNNMQRALVNILR